MARLTHAQMLNTLRPGGPERPDTAAELAERARTNLENARDAHHATDPVFESAEHRDTLIATAIAQALTSIALSLTGCPDRP